MDWLGMLKDYAEHQENTMIRGFMDTTREAFQLQIIDKGEVWMDGRMDMTQCEK